MLSTVCASAEAGKEEACAGRKLNNSNIGANRKQARKHTLIKASQSTGTNTERRMPGYFAARPQNQKSFSSRTVTHGLVSREDSRDLTGQALARCLRGAVVSAHGCLKGQSCCLSFVY